MSNVKGIATIELKSDRFVGDAKKAERAIEKTGATGQRALQKVGTSADSAGQKVQASMQRGVQSAGQLGSAGARAGTNVSQGMLIATTSVNNLTASMQRATVSSGTMVLGIAALGTSVGTTFTGMSNLNKAHLKQGKAVQKVLKVTVGLARANDLLSSTQLAVQRFTISIAAMEEKGLQSTATYTIAKANLALQLQKLVTAQSDYSVKLADIKLAELDALQVADDLQDTYINMTISLANTGLMSAFLAKTLMPNLGKQMLILKIRTLTSSRAFSSLIFSMKKFRVQMAGASVGFKTMGLSVRSFMLALGPLGIAMIAIGIAFEIWETNAFGVQEAVAELWNWLKKIIPILSALEVLVKSVFPDTEEGLETVGELAEESGAQMEEFGDITQAVGEDLKTGLITDLALLDQGFGDVTKGANTAGDAIEDFKKKRSDLSRTVSGDQSGSFADELFGLNGIFTQTGRQLAGFRGDFILISRPGREQAIKLAMKRFGINRQAAEQITATTIAMRSRVLTNRPVVSGGGAADAIRNFVTSSFNNFENPAFRGGPRTAAGRFDPTRALAFARDRRAAEKTRRNSGAFIRSQIISSILTGSRGGVTSFRLDRGQSLRLRKRGIGAIPAADAKALRQASRFGVLGAHDGSSRGIILAARKGVADLNRRLMAAVGKNLDQIIAETTITGLDTRRFASLRGGFARGSATPGGARGAQARANIRLTNTQLGAAIAFALDAPRRAAQAARDLVNQQAFDDRATLEANLV